MQHHRQRANSVRYPDQRRLKACRTGHVPLFSVNRLVRACQTNLTFQDTLIEGRSDDESSRARQTEVPHNGAGNHSKYLWDVIDKIHAAVDDVRHGIPGAASALPGSVERLAREALMTVKRPAAQPPEPTGEDEAVLGEV